MAEVTVTSNGATFTLDLADVEIDALRAADAAVVGTSALDDEITDERQDAIDTVVAALWSLGWSPRDAVQTTLDVIDALPTV